jgi:hypothetical protein
LIELKIAQIKQALEPVKPLEPQNADGAGATTPKQRGDFHKLTIELN